MQLFPVLAASIPLTILGVWNFFFLGQAWAKEINDEQAASCREARACRRSGSRRSTKVSKKKGVSVVLFGRLAAFPSTMIAAAAGASRMKAKQFLPADGIGGVASVAEVLIAGYLFGEAYKKAGTGITVIGVVVFIGLLVAVGRWLARET